MSNFMMVLCSRPESRRIADFLGGDCQIVSLGSRCLIIHPADRYQDPEGLFIGHSVDHQKRRVAFSDAETRRWPSVISPTEGCYVRAEVHYTANKGAVVRLGGDKFRLLPILHFFEAQTLAASDSLFLLAALRRHLGLDVKAHEEAVLSRLWQNGIADQLLSTDTPVAGIFYCPVGAYLEASAGESSVDLKVKGGLANDVFGLPDHDYTEIVARGASRIADLVATACSIPGATVSLDLSGGFDSRVSFAAAVHAGLLDKVDVISSQELQKDFLVASSIARKFCVPLNQELGRAPLGESTESPLTQWAVFSAGIYDPLYSVPHRRSSVAQFKISGHGAELYKGNYGWRRIRTISRYVPAAARAAFRAQAEKGLAAIGVPPDDHWGSEWCYAAYRNSVHSGRITMTSLIGLRPLLQSELLGLSRSDKNFFPAPKKNAPSIVTDLLIALSPELAAMPYDADEKNLSAHFVAERKSCLGKLSPATPYDIDGSPAGVPGGASAAAASLAVRSGFSGEFDENPNVDSLIRRGYEIAPSALRDALQPLLHEAMDPAGRSSSPHRASRAAGKLMMLSLLDA